MVLLMGAPGAPTSLRDLGLPEDALDDAGGGLVEGVLGQAEVAQGRGGVEVGVEAEQAGQGVRRVERGGDPGGGVGRGVGVEGEHVREHHRVRLGVGEVPRAAEDVADLVVQPGAGAGEGRGGEVGAVQAAGAGGEVAAVGHDAAERRGEGPDALGGGGVEDGVAAGRPERVDAVGQRVEAAGDGEVDGEADRELGVVDDHPGQDDGVGAGGLGAALGEAPDGRGLRAGVGGGDRDDREAGGQRDRLGQPGGRAAADAEDEVGVHVGGQPAGGLRHLDRDVGADAGEACGDGEVGGERVGETGLGLGAGQQHPGGAEGTDLLGQRAAGGARAEDESLRVRLVPELQRRHRSSWSRRAVTALTPAASDQSRTGGVIRPISIGMPSDSICVWISGSCATSPRSCGRDRSRGRPPPST
nr:hypothetical protein [Nocardioides sp. AX2bis]